MFVRARKHRAQNRSVYKIHEDSSTGVTPLSRTCAPEGEKCIFRSALLSYELRDQIEQPQEYWLVQQINQQAVSTGKRQRGDQGMLVLPVQYTA